MSSNADRTELPERWYVLNHIGQTPRDNATNDLDKFSRQTGINLNLFAPTYTTMENRNGVMVMRTRPLAFHYVFVRGKLHDIKQLCSCDNGFSFLLDPAGNERYAMVEDSQMYMFMQIARHYQNRLPFFSLDEIDLEEGDLVEVVNGDFPGLIGTFIPHPKSKRGKVVLSVAHTLATAAYNINVQDVRILEFARGSKRAYDQIDAFVPRLLGALRLHHAGEALPRKIISPVIIFLQRMEMTRLDNRKLEAKLTALLLAASAVVGDRDRHIRFRQLHERCRPAISNAWTLALTELVIAVAERDRASLLNGFKLIEGLQPASRQQSQIKEEYEHYLAPAATDR